MPKKAAAPMQPIKVFDYEEWKRNPFPVLACDLFKNMPLEVFIEDWMTIESTEEDSIGQQIPFVLWPKQRDLCRYLDKNKLGFIPKARQRGGSEILACLAIKVILSEMKAECLVFSRMEDDARYFLDKRVITKLKALPHIMNSKGEECIIWPKLDIQTFKITTSYGSTITAISSHPDAGSGHTARLIILDEAEKIEDAAAIWTAVKPAVDQNPRGQLFALSTGQKHGTWFKIFLRKIYDGKVQGITYFFLPWNADPSKDKAWYDRELTQFDSEVDMRCTYPSDIEDIFMSKEGKIFPQFDAKVGGRHVYDFEARMRTSDLWNMDMYVAYDPGYDPHPAAFVLCLYDRFSDILYVMDEIVLVGVEITEMGKKVKAMVGGRPIRPKKAVVDTYANRKGGAGGKITERKILNEVTGINFVGADKADADGSRQLLSKRFSENKIVIHPNCKKTRSQIEDWVWDSNGKPVDEEDDTIDCLRYICAVLPNRPQKAPVPPEGVRSYSSEARRARMRARAELEAMKNRSANGNDHYSWQAG
jgi:hypothetical protein